MLAFKFHVLLALLHVLQNGNPEGVVAESDVPFTFVDLLLSYTSISQVTFKLLVIDLIDLDEVVCESVKCLTVSDADQVLHPVAVIAQRFESHQPLVSCALVVIPDLVAIEPRVPPADLASVRGAFVYTLSDSVPLRSRQELG